MVFRLIGWVLVWKLPLLLFCPSSSSDSKRGREGGVLGTSEDVKSRFGRLLVAGWVVVLGGVLLLILFPKTVWIPGPEVMRVSIIVLVLTSVVYGLTVIYRQGTDRAKRK